MFWNEDKQREEYQVPDNVVDLSFAVKCKCLPNERMGDLSKALMKELPWLEDEKFAGLHSIYGPESGNGWERSCDPDELMYFSRRQKMTMRLPKERVEAAELLVGKTLDVNGYEMEFGNTSIKMLSDLPTTFCRQVMTSESMAEEDFLTWAYNELKKLDIDVKKMMAGKERIITQHDGNEKITRSLMVAELDKEQSVRLQEHGMGEGRMLGCGLFVPQKDIKAVNSDG